MTHYRVRRGLFLLTYQKSPLHVLNVPFFVPDVTAIRTKCHRFSYQTSPFFVPNVTFYRTKCHLCSTKCHFYSTKCHLYTPQTRIITGFFCSLSSRSILKYVRSTSAITQKHKRSKLRSKSRSKPQAKIHKYSSYQMSHLTHLLVAAY